MSSKFKGTKIFTVAGSEFVLTANKLQETKLGYLRSVTRSQLKKFFKRGGYSLFVKVHYPAKLWEFESHYIEHTVEIVDGSIAIGCMEFDVENTAKIRRWALRAVKKATVTTTKSSRRAA